jgi:hypothetical protein
LQTVTVVHREILDQLIFEELEVISIVCGILSSGKVPGENSLINKKNLLVGSQGLEAPLQVRGVLNLYILGL